MNLLRAAVWLPVLLFGLHANTSFGQAAEDPRDLRGRWLVVVEGDAETRTLVISDVSPASDGGALAAAYGMSNGNQTPIPARVKVGEARELHFTTQASTVVRATEQADGSFQGTFTRRGGGVSKVVITRVSTDVTAASPLPRKDMAAVVPLGADVSPGCGAFHGVWSGRWSQGDIPEQFLRVLEVAEKEGKCSARLSYTPSKAPVPATRVVAFEGNSLTFECNRSQGNCSFKRVGQELWASYSSPGGGSNSAVFRRVAP